MAHPCSAPARACAPARRVAASRRRRCALPAAASARGDGAPAPALPQQLPLRREVLAAAAAAAAAAATARAARAAEPSQCAAGAASSGAAAYDAYAESYDTLNDGAFANALGLPELRAALLARAEGDVLEIGAGTGLNLPLYRLQPGGAIRSLTAVDLSADMLAVARRRATSLGLCEASRSEPTAAATPPLRFLQADATSLPFPDASFDTVLDTFSLCVLGGAAPAALAELARVLRPSGRALLLEHARSTFGPLGAYQDATAVAVAAAGKGCLWNQDVLAMLPLAGLRARRSQPALGGTLLSIEAERA